MEYGIYFNNDNAYETVIVALEELENTYFIENSSSESENNSTNGDENTSDDEIISINENFNINSFEFVNNSNSYYIDDKIYNNLKLKVGKVFENAKYLYQSNCFEKIDFK